MFLLTCIYTLISIPKFFCSIIRKVNGYKRAFEESIVDFVKDKSL